MGLFSSGGTDVRHYPVQPGTVAASIAVTAGNAGHTSAYISAEPVQYAVDTKRTPLNWGTRIILMLSPEGDGGTRLDIAYDNIPGTPSALMDGRKNAKTVAKFLDLLDAQVSSQG